VQGCNANLRIYSADMSVEAYFLYRLDPLSTTYKLIATLPGTSSNLVLGYLDTNLFGKFSYYVVTYTGPLQQASSIAVVTISDPSCNQGQWSSLIVTQASMTTTSPMAGGVYCYLSLNNNSWGRMPVTGTIPYSAGGYNLISDFPNITLAPMPPTILVTLDCWGYNGGVLAHLGKASKSFSTSGLPVALVITGTGFSMTIVFDKGAPPPGSQTAPSNLTPPVSLRSVQNVQDCVSHMPGGLAELFTSLVCGSAMSNHYQVLIWEWNPLTCPAFSPVTCSLDNQIDGYRVYQVTDSGQTSLVQEQQSIDTKAYPFPQPSANASGNLPCYVVRSFKGAAESVNSNLFCLPSSAPGAASVTLKPNNLYTLNATNQARNNDSYCIFSSFFGTIDTEPVIQSTDGSVDASYNYFWDPGTQPLPCWRYQNQVQQAFASFYISRVLVPNNVYTASLTFNRQDTGCGPSLNLVNDYTAVAVNNFDSIIVLPAGTNQNIDVSGVVRNWQMAHPDPAGTTIPFMINTNYENLNARDNNSCYEGFNSFVLTLTYFPQ